MLLDIQGTEVKTGSMVAFSHKSGKLIVGKVLEIEDDATLVIHWGCISTVDRKPEEVAVVK
jgi:hypothetical protein